MLCTLRRIIFNGFRLCLKHYFHVHCKLSAKYVYGIVTVVQGVQVFFVRADSFTSVIGNLNIGALRAKPKGYA